MSSIDPIYQKLQQSIDTLQSVEVNTPTPAQNVIRLRIDDYFAFLHTFFVLDTKHDFLGGRVKDVETKKKIDNLLNYYARKLRNEYDQLTADTEGQVVSGESKTASTTFYNRMLQSLWYPEMVGSNSPGTGRTFEEEILLFYLQTVKDIGQALADELPGGRRTTREQNQSNQLYSCYLRAKNLKEKYCSVGRERMAYLNAAASTSIGTGKNKIRGHDTKDGLGSFELKSKTGEPASFTFTSATFNKAKKYNIASFIDGAGSGIYNKTKKRISPYELGNTNIKFICGNLDQVFISFKMNTAFEKVDGNNKLISRMWITRSYPDTSSSTLRASSTAHFYFNISDGYSVKVSDEIKNTSQTPYNAGSIFYYAHESFPRSSDLADAHPEVEPPDMVFISRKPFCDFGQSLNMFLINGGYQSDNIMFDEDVIPPVNTQTNEILSEAPNSKRRRRSSVSSTSSVLPQVGFPVVSIHGDQPATGLAFFLISASALYRNPVGTVSANRFLNEFPHVVYSVAIPTKKEKQKDIGKKFVFANKFGNIALTAHHLVGSVPKKTQATRRSNRKRARTGGTREMFIDLRRDEIILCNKIFSQICLFNVDSSVVKIYNSYLKYLYDRDFKITWKKMAFARGRDGVWQKLFRKVEDPEILSSFINKLKQGTYINSGEYYENLNIIKNSVGEDDLDKYFYDAYYYVKLLNSLPKDDVMYFNNDNYSLREILGLSSNKLPQIYIKLGDSSSPAKKAFSYVRQYDTKKKSTKCRDIRPTQPTQRTARARNQTRRRRRIRVAHDPFDADDISSIASADSQLQSLPASPARLGRSSMLGQSSSMLDPSSMETTAFGLSPQRKLVGEGYISYKKNKRQPRRRKKKTKRRRKKKKKTRRKNKRKKKTKRRRKKKKKTRRRQ